MEYFALPTVTTNKICGRLAGAAGCMLQALVVFGAPAAAHATDLTYTPVNLLDIKLNKDGAVDIPIPASHNTALLVIRGEVSVNGQSAPEHSFVLFANQGEEISLQAKSAAVLLLLSGEPIDEPIVSYGPFVMNTKQEIMEAIEDFQAGKFGYLE